MLNLRCYLNVGVVDGPLSCSELHEPTIKATLNIFTHIKFQPSQICKVEAVPASRSSCFFFLKLFCVTEQPAETLNRKSVVALAVRPHSGIFVSVYREHRGGLIKGGV